MKTYTQQIIRVLERITASGMGQQQIFDDFLEIASDCLTRLPEHTASTRLTGKVSQDPPEMVARWDRLRSRYNSQHYFDLFAQAFALLMKSAQDDWNDTIGEVYMEFGHPSKWGGQFFTPFYLAEMMAKVSVSLSSPHNVPSLVHERIKDACKGDPLAESILLTSVGLKGGEAEEWYFTKLIPLVAPRVEHVKIHDPACGSGVMFLAAASQIPRWMLDWNFVRFYGQDIDQTCVQMAQINLMLHGLNGYAIQCAAALIDIEKPIEVTRELLSLQAGEVLHEA